MRQWLQSMTALLLIVLLTVPAMVTAQGTAPEVIRGRQKSPAKPADTDLAYQQGLNFQQAGKYKAAIKAFQQALKNKPNAAEIHYQLGLAYAAQGEQDKAIKSLQDALRFKPDLKEARHSLGEIYGRRGLALLRQGNPNAAEASLKEAILQNPKDDGAFNNLGVALGQQGRWNESLASLREAVTLNPNNTKAQYNLGVTSYAMGDKNAAVQQYAILTASDPNAAAELFKIIQGTRTIATPFLF